MLLYANGYRLGLGAARAFSGVASLAGGARREALELSGARRNYSMGWASVSGETSKASVPNGARHPVAWLTPQKAGGLSAYSGLEATVTPGALTLAEGRNLTGSGTITVTVDDAQLELVVSATGSATITWTPSGTLAGALSATGSASVTWTVDAATLGAVIDAVASASCAMTGSGTPSALGHMEGDILPYTELSPEALAVAVWQYATRDVNITQVNGIDVDGSGTSGDPWGPV
jgi:hypothetical protein